VSELCGRRNPEPTYHEPTTCTRKSGSAEEQSDAEMLLVSLVPHAKIEHDSREEPAFRDAQTEAGGEQPGEILREPHESADDPPYDCNSGKPESRRRPFEDNVTGDLGQRVAGEPNRQCREVLVVGLFQPVRFASIADTRE
jgi:hypothetical protein